MCLSLSLSHTQCAFLCLVYHYPFFLPFSHLFLSTCDQNDQSFSRRKESTARKDWWSKRKTCHNLYQAERCCFVDIEGPKMKWFALSINHASAAGSGGRAVFTPRSRLFKQQLATHQHQHRAPRQSTAVSAPQVLPLCALFIGSFRVRHFRQGHFNPLFVPSRHRGPEGVLHLEREIFRALSWIPAERFLFTGLSKTCPPPAQSDGHFAVWASKLTWWVGDGETRKWNPVVFCFVPSWEGLISSRQLTFPWNSLTFYSLWKTVIWDAEFEKHVFVHSREWENVGLNFSADRFPTNTQ